MKKYKLYVMTHKITGLKYLGYTSKDLSTYYGSGVYWKKHIKVHGRLVDKEILHECDDLQEISDLGAYYSRVWNIVEAVDENGKKLWANEKPETGQGGSSPAIVAKARQTKIKNNTLESNPEIIEKIKQTKKKNGTDKNVWTKTSYDKWKNGILNKYGSLNRNTPETIRKASETREKNGTSFRDIAIKEKIKETKIKNNTLNPNTPSMIEAQRITKHKKFVEKHKDIIDAVVSLYTEGLCKFRISKQLNASYSTVSTIIEKFLKGLI